MALDLSTPVPPAKVFPNELEALYDKLAACSTVINNIFQHFYNDISDQKWSSSYIESLIKTEVSREGLDISEYLSSTHSDGYRIRLVDKTT